MPRWGMVIDLDKCFACQSCTAACRMENNTPIAGKDQADMGRAILWNEVLPFVEGEYPNVKTTIMPRPCMHCETPACVTACMSGALQYGTRDDFDMSDLSNDFSGTPSSLPPPSFSRAQPSSASCSRSSLRAC